MTTDDAQVVNSTAVVSETIQQKLMREASHPEKQLSADHLPYHRLWKN